MYRLWSRKYLGADLDLRDAYQWGWEELGRIDAERAAAAGRIVPGGLPVDAAAALDADARYRVVGQDAFRDWMQERTDRALADLAGTHFDIPAQLRQLECRIAPPGTAGGAYYTGPAEDFSLRPPVVAGASGQGRVHQLARPQHGLP